MEEIYNIIAFVMGIVGLGGFFYHMYRGIKENQRLNRERENRTDLRTVDK